jgi:uncharacterized membrane protein YfcA
LSGAEIALVLLIVVAAACVHGVIGFGFAIAAAPVLILVDSALVPGPVLFAVLPLTALMLHRERRHVHFRSVSWALAGNALGSIASAGTILVFPEERFAVLFGVLVLAAVGLTALGIRFKVTARSSLLAGAASGFMGTATSIGGPPMALLYEGEAASRLRADLAAYFLVGALFALIALSFVGRFGRVEAQLGAMLVPGVVGGFYLSSVVAPRLNAWVSRLLVLTAAGACAVFLIARGMLQTVF